MSLRLVLQAHAMSISTTTPRALVKRASMGASIA
jgi:hypothetical protein